VGRPIAGVRVLRGDITTDETADAVVAGLGGERADLVLCDGAAEVTGLHDLDEHLHSQLLGAATRLSRRVLAPGGAFLAKIFRSRDGPDLLRSQLRVLFRHVDVAKPASSRDRSGEVWSAVDCLAPTPDDRRPSSSVEATCPWRRPRGTPPSSSRTSPSVTSPATTTHLTRT